MEAAVGEIWDAVEFERFKEENPPQHRYRTFRGDLDTPVRLRLPVKLSSRHDPTARKALILEAAAEQPRLVFDVQFALEALRAHGDDADRLAVEKLLGRLVSDNRMLVRQMLGRFRLVNTLFKGDYSEASRTPTRPPFEKWWADGAPLAT
jgi:hypothetical protein